MHEFITYPGEMTMNPRVTRGLAGLILVLIKKAGPYSYRILSSFLGALALTAFIPSNAVLPILKNYSW